jgi:hypothetical protein
VPATAAAATGGSASTRSPPPSQCWVTIPDALAATLLQGRPPRILRAITFRPTGRNIGMRPFQICGSRPIDPEQQDGFRALVEERRRYVPVRRTRAPRPARQAGPPLPALALTEAATHACTHAAYRDRHQPTKARLGKQRGAKVAQVDLARKLAEAGTCSPAPTLRPGRRHRPPGRLTAPSFEAARHGVQGLVNTMAERCDVGKENSLFASIRRADRTVPNGKTGTCAVAFEHGRGGTSRPATQGSSTCTLTGSRRKKRLNVEARCAIKGRLVS